MDEKDLREATEIGWNTMDKFLADKQPHESAGWYAIGFADDKDEINWDAAPIYYYNGDGQWEDENGESIEFFFDPFLQFPVSTHAADAYLKQ